MEGPGELHSVTQQTTAVNGVSHSDCIRKLNQGRNVIFRAEVGMNIKTTQVAARYFVLAMAWQQRGMTVRSTDKGGSYPIQADFGKNLETMPKVPVRQTARLSIGRQQRGTVLTE